MFCKTPIIARSDILTVTYYELIVFVKMHPWQSRPFSNHPPTLIFVWLWSFKSNICLNNRILQLHEFTNSLMIVNNKRVLVTFYKKSDENSVFYRDTQKHFHITGGPPLTWNSLTRFPLPRFFAYVRVSGGISVSRGPQYSPTNTNFM